MALPWFKRQGEELPPELQGLEVKDLVDAVANSKKVTDLEAKLTLAEQKAGEVDDVKNQLRALEARVPRPVVEESKTKQPTSFLDDENQAFNERLAPFAIATLNAQSQNAKFIARQSLKGLDCQMWDKYSSEIDDVMSTVDLQHKALSETWINALNVVAGRHRHDILKMANDKTDFFSETAGGTGDGGPSNEEPIRLSNEQAAVAKRLGISTEDYLKNLKEMTVRA